MKSLHMQPIHLGKEALLELETQKTRSVGYRAAPNAPTTAKRFSTKGLIPPAELSLHTEDCYVHIGSYFQRLALSPRQDKHRFLRVPAGSPL
jgi:hypothetical protein